MFCPNCGKEVKDGAKFCPYCGKSLETNELKLSRRSSKKPLSIIIPLILIIVIASSLFIFVKYIKPNITSNEQETVATLIPYRKKDKWGFCDRNKKIVIQPTYDWASSFSEGLARVGIGEYPNTKYGFIDKKGNYVIQPIYDEAWSFSEGLAPVGIGKLLNTKWGFIDKKRNYVIQPTYDWASSFSEGLARVVLNDKYGYIDTKGTQYWED